MGELENFDEGDTDFQKIVRFCFDFILRLSHFLYLYLILVVVTVILFLLAYCLRTPVYTAEATIGPPNPSSISSTVMGSDPVMGGVARRLLGNSSSSGNDPYQEYQQLMHSPRLAVELAQKDNFLPIIFDKSWDAAHHMWKPHGMLHPIKAAIFALFKRPVADHPDVDSLEAYLNLNLGIAPSKSARESSVAEIAGVGGPYMTLTFPAGSPEEAERLLSTILQRADTAIREEQLRDVKARIDYIESELPLITQTDQRQALIEALASQEELNVMMVADKRFAYVLVSPPYASLTPTSPGSPVTAIALSIFVSLLLWIALVALEPKVAFLQRWLAVFKRP